MRLTQRTGALVLTVTLGVAACGSNGDGQGASVTDTPVAGMTTLSTTKDTSATGGSRRSAPRSPTSGGGSTGADAPRPPDESQAKPLPLKPTLGKKCLHAGDTQSIVIQTEPEAFVGYSSVYSDGKTGLDPGFYGGAAQGQADASGRYADTWTVTPTAPSGDVTVDVLGSKPGWRIGQTAVTYTIKPPESPC